jgi:hypothetical protein
VERVGPRVGDPVRGVPPSDLRVRDPLVIVGAATAGIVTGLVWSRWRHDVVAELRKIRRLLERSIGRNNDRSDPG